MTFYRYEYREYATVDQFGDFVSPVFPDPKIILEEYDLIKETPKGYWIGQFFLPFQGEPFFKKWVSKTATKRFAYPTKEEALTNLIKRTEKRLKILTRQADVCQVILTKAKTIKL
jgi:hypothetical protein